MHDLVSGSKSFKRICFANFTSWRNNNIVLSNEMFANIISAARKQHFRWPEMLQTTFPVDRNITNDICGGRKCHKQHFRRLEISQTAFQVAGNIINSISGGRKYYTHKFRWPEMFQTHLILQELPYQNM